MSQQKGIIYLVLFMGMLWCVGLLANRFLPHDPLEIHLVERLSLPSAANLCGTDELGRDIFSRMIVGFSNTVNVSLMALISSFILGTCIGSLAGYYYRTFIDTLFNWLATILFSLPFLLVIAAIISLMEKNLFNAYLVLTAVIWVAPARIVRAGIIRARTEQFVVAERAMGRSEFSIFCKSLIPMSIGPAFLFSFKYLPEIIGLEAGLSFLGLGIQPPQPGLGKMIFDSLNYLYSAWWYAFFPGLLLFITVLAINLVYTFANSKNTFQ